ncbi:MmgE/PrpD family protein [Arthrobacter gengyunqii]|uniref:MmgE/PrpD family protein n=1 Tax=Arthrobacter gengyunqii TaxID=2886940 RepID=A0ABS8GNV1_9MICC|nr:MmgE/PrpD family protein [Arthrobacter gengyunqii]MCC3266943.1 MmgE/PrpD family protein [Arthrobacter gengyunqii]
MSAAEHTPGERTLAQQLGDFAAGVRYENLPAEVIESVKSRVLDILGIAAAAAPLDTSRAARRWAIDQGGTPAASAVGVAELLPAGQAAFVNGVLAHSLDYDDTHLPSVLHPSASVIPAVLAAAQAAGKDGRETIAAIAVGLEICVRLGMAGYDTEAKNSTFFEHGQHATSICGAMGAAAGVAALHRNAQWVTDALGVAASMASGIIESNRTGGTVKRIHCGWAAHSAVTAVDLVRYGLTGPPTVLEGRFGFFQAWLHGQFNPAEITDGLGERWQVQDIFFKPYPANHFTHAAVDAAAALRRAGIGPDDVESLTLGVPAPNLRTIGEPLAVKQKPETGYMAQFSGPYAVAAGLLGGGGLEVGLDDYTDELARDELRRSIMARVEVVADEECTAIFPMQFPAVLTARLRDGRTVTEKVLTTRGGPQRPLGFEDLGRKFEDNARRTLAPAARERLRETCRTLPDCQNLAVLFQDLTTADADGLTVAGTTN